MSRIEIGSGAIMTVDQIAVHVQALKRRAMTESGRTRVATLLRVLELTRLLHDKNRIAAMTGGA